MNVELFEIRDFLAGVHPFDRLPPEVLDRLPRDCSVRYLRRGSTFPPEGRAGLYVVRRGAIELRDPSGGLTDKFAEGDLFTAPCGAQPLSSDDQATAVEDSLFYVLPCERVEALRTQHREFDAHFSESQGERLKRALRALQTADARGPGLLEVSVGALIARAPVHVTGDTPIQEAARRMTDEGISALLIMEAGRLEGLVTDHDLRARCLVPGLPYERPVREIMSRGLQTVGPGARAFEALLAMTRLDIHHLPVVDEGRVLGLISTTDLIRYESTNSVYLVRDVRRCETVSALQHVTRALPELQIQLATSGASAYDLGQAITSVTDAMTRRLLEMAEAELGPPPAPYAWLASGSQGRAEQLAHTDQDNVLLLADGLDADQASYFEALAAQVCEGLDACGIAYCPGEVMATNPQWRQPLSTWTAYFRDWIGHPERKSVMLASNFSDLRFICGDPDLFDRLHAMVLKEAQGNRIFLAHLAANAVRNRPPVGFFRNLVLTRGGEQSGGFDLKRRGVLPVADLARVYALSAGLPQVNTVERLRAAAEAEALSREGAADLAEAFEFIATLRARHQARQMKAGDGPDNYVQPEELSTLERGHLKDAFAVIATMQQALELRHQAGRFF